MFSSPRTVDVFGIVAGLSRTTSGLTIPGIHHTKVLVAVGHIIIEGRLRGHKLVGKLYKRQASICKALDLRQSAISTGRSTKVLDLPREAFLL